MGFDRLYFYRRYNKARKTQVPPLYLDLRPILLTEYAPLAV